MTSAADPLGYQGSSSVELTEWKPFDFATPVTVCFRLVLLSISYFFTFPFVRDKNHGNYTQFDRFLINTLRIGKRLQDERRLAQRIPCTKIHSERWTTANKKKTINQRMTNRTGEGKAILIEQKTTQWNKDKRRRAKGKPTDVSLKVTSRQTYAFLRDSFRC